jgi:hypothetical protein
MVLSAVATTMASSTAISEPAEVSASTHVLVARRLLHSWFDVLLIAGSGHGNQAWWT